MTRKISDAQFLQLGDFVAGHFGLHFPEERWCDLQRAAEGAIEQCGYRRDLECYVRELLAPVSGQKLLQVFANHLTVGENYFFREKRSLELLEERIVPELIRAGTDRKRPIRIWCARCSTGEEPYSIAILLDKLQAGLPAAEEGSTDRSLRLTPSP